MRTIVLGLIAAILLIGLAGSCFAGRPVDFQWWKWWHDEPAPAISSTDSIGSTANSAGSAGVQRVEALGRCVWMEGCSSQIPDKVSEGAVYAQGDLRQDGGCSWAIFWPGQKVKKPNATVTYVALHGDPSLLEQEAQRRGVSACGADSRYP